jgi:hypothetical protein
MNSISIENIPEELKQLKQWVLWKIEFEQKGKEKKPKKKPKRVDTLKNASTTKENTWSSFEDAVTAYENNKGYVDGIGFVFTDNDPFVGIDLDDVIIDGIIEPYAQEIIREVDSYTEYSPSGQGVHVFVKGEKFQNIQKDIEIFNRSKFLTVTGNHLSETPLKIREIDIRNIPCAEKYLKEGNRPTIKKEKKVNKDIDLDGLSKEEVEILEELKINSLFNDLYYEGKLDKYQGDQSRGDLALCNMLVHSCGDEVIVDKLFRRSKLYRNKWDEIHSADGKTYGEMTIEKAFSQEDLYEKKSRKRLSVQEVLACEETIVPILDGLFYEKSLHLLTADAGLGKSVFMYNFAVQLTQGGKFLDVALKPRKVLYYDLETNDARRKNILKKINVDPNNKLLEFGQDPDLNLPLQSITNVVIDEGFEVLIIDTYAQFFNVVKEDDNGVINKIIISPLRRFTQKTGCAVILIHHHGKNEGLKSQVYKARGATALPAGMDVVMNMTVTNNPDVLRLSITKNKMAEIIPDLFLQKTFYRFLRITPTNGEISKKEMAKSKVLNVLRNCTSSIPRKEIFNLVCSDISVSEETVKLVLKELEKESSIRRVHRGNYQIV